MRWSDIPFKPTSRMLRQFAAMGAVVLIGLGCWLGFGQGSWAIAAALLMAAAVVGVVAALWPGALRPIFVGWMCLAFPVGWVLSHVVLAVLFFGLFTPVGLFQRLIGRDVLVRRRRPAYDSYWKPKPAAPDVNSYFRLS
jgi:hypothetical protein